ncbi:vWA domain-containing protein [Pseudobacteriovorax antillogorgiicola]|uniref:von Willebrand factor type A domain-containing protein n=1 Tax=Pseudobacteriovorax antillogorgiicola TaxID=1513793 RepID=A0A1Y6CDJ7_9BACT|nr:VWA domain-containing protein [Pseudobacteriovorax antillogorgiicola]TCS48232.1 von Willebrand factor type A domain-containing protein [Pseudobacteriovorax antillogorgiicola]SMF57315.1 von Willebrand factor type A domain-containing protein [Pseudobacteriovorax antillogorgiicola]
MKQLLILLMLVGVSCTKKSPKSDPKDDTLSSENRPNLAKVYRWPPAADIEFEVLPEDRRLAKNYYIVFDGSGSMGDTKCADGQKKAQVAVKALKQFASNVPPRDNLGLLVFDNRGLEERVPLNINNRETFFDELYSVKVGGGTPLGSAIELGKVKLEQQARRQLGYGEYNLIVVTDGEADSNDLPHKAVDYLVSETPVVVQTIGFCIGSDHTLNRPQETVYKSANNSKELLSSLEEVLAESETFVDTQFEQ